MDIHYSPPWADTSIIGIAGSSGSGKTSIALEVVRALNLPWVVILSMVGCKTSSSQSPSYHSNYTKDSFYNVLTPAQHEAAFRNEFDFDSPEAIDFDVLVQVLKDLKQGSVRILFAHGQSDYQQEES